MAASQMELLKQRAQDALDDPGRSPSPVLAAEPADIQEIPPLSLSTIPPLQQRNGPPPTRVPSKEPSHNPSRRPSVSLADENVESHNRPSITDGQRGTSSRPSSAALPTRTGSPSIGRRPGSAFGKSPASRTDHTKQYEGKEFEAGKRGGYGPGGYDVKVSRTGTPRGQTLGTPVFGEAHGSGRPSTAKQYEGKEFEEGKRGGYGPGGYDVKVSNTGTPRGQTLGTPVFGEAHGPARPSTAKQYEGKEFEAGKRGGYGPGGYDVKVSRTGTPRGQTLGTPVFGEAHGPARPSTAKQYEGKEFEEGKRGGYGPGAYDVKVSRTGSPLMGFGKGVSFGKAAMRRSQSAGAVRGAGYGNVQVSRNGSPLMGQRAASAFGKTTASRSNAKQYCGKEWEGSSRGHYGPGNYDVKVSNKGARIGESRGTPIFGGATTVQRPGAEVRRYSGREFEANQRGLNTYCKSAGYDPACAFGKQASSRYQTGRSCSFGHGGRDVFARLYQGKE